MQDQDDIVEISLADIVQFLKDSRAAVIKSTIAFTLIGVVVALLNKNEFVSEAKVLPELKSASTAGLGGNLSALAGLAGINLDNMSSTDAVRPDLYPNVLQSMPFAMHLLKQQVYVSSMKKSMTLEVYLDESAKIPYIESWFESASDTAQLYDPKGLSKTLEISKKQENLTKDVLKRVSATFDKKTAIITISAKMRDRVVAASVARLSLEYLLNYVSTYRTDKVRKQLKFLYERVQEARRRYQGAQVALQSYKDSHRGLVMNMAQIEGERLLSEFVLAQTVYTDLSKQFEQTKIKVEEETPVFKTLEMPRIPIKKTEPQRTVMVFGFAVLGVVIGLLVAYAKRWFATNNLTPQVKDAKS